MKLSVNTWTVHKWNKNGWTPKWNPWTTKTMFRKILFFIFVIVLLIRKNAISFLVCFHEISTDILCAQS